MNRKLLNILGACLLCSVPAFADGPKPPSELSDPVALLLLAVIGGLLLVIGILGNAVTGAVDIFREKMKNDTAKTIVVMIGMISIALISSSPAFGQDAAPVASAYFTRLSQPSFYLLISIIALELCVIIALLFVLRFLVGIRRKRKPAAETVPGTPRISWLEKLNKTRTLDAASETEEDMGHDFDGIHELNNPTPPWWKWGFIFSVCFGVVYFWRTEISQSAPNQLQELAMAEEKAAVAREEYLKNAANNIDENNVKLLEDPNDLAAGQKLFVSSCAPCHGPQGQGVVGPNLTDDYWLHGGKINEVFKTIKYGVPDKGMKSWQEDFSPKQLAQLASFIKSIHGTNPPNQKDPQGAKE
ncbi:MAG TPA: cbb3-type cytochrome c oxidase N-terminal domain-containing protein [Chitinophaga sp.]|uniref:cbb3-type cytochrome c oxidase N-terminal domain-containing protein n=1 Tax=Chitinophaga sp. TaxID=1869181 RepID=UPI002C15B341|nr:cbb3-type cytochrome c oxidase N-terminal domain-containing protein [Chitinophaga sp.]HVI48011.1 cbb3-type cytochrome c oxidase N-terminal domain-containing protein [Chitinophaga sp.]